MLDLNMQELIEIYDELANYTVSVMRNHAHSRAKELPELIETLIKLKRFIKQESIPSRRL